MASSSSLICSCCATKILFQQSLRTACDVKIKGCHNIPCSNCFLKFKEHHCVPLDSDAHLIFNKIIHTKSKGQTDKFLQQRGWFLDDVEEAFAGIFKPDRTQLQSRTSPAAGSAAWPENIPVFISLSTVPNNAVVNSSDNLRPPIVDSVTYSGDEDKDEHDHVVEMISRPIRSVNWPDENSIRSPVTYTYPSLVTHIDDDLKSEGIDYSDDSYYTNHSDHTVAIHKSGDYISESDSDYDLESVSEREEWGFYQSFERSVVRRRPTILEELKRTVSDLFSGTRIR